MQLSLLIPNKATSQPTRHLALAVWLGLFSLLCGGLPVHAAETDRFAQRAQYQDAISAIKKGQKTRYHELRETLTHYPLYPYLEYTDKIYNLRRQSTDAINTFISDWQDTPLASQLRQNWLYLLGKQGRWREFLATYAAADATAINQCFYAYALFKEDRAEEAFQAARQLWLVGRSQPDECDPIFKVSRETGILDEQLGWQRFQLAMTNGELTLARYLERFLSPADKSLARSYQQVHKTPSLVANPARFTPDSSQQRQIISHGIRRLARRDAAQALRALQQYQQTHQFSETDISEMVAFIGIRLSQAGDPDGLLDQLPVSLTGHTGLIEARIRLALQQLNWSQALVMINLLDSEEQQQTRWQYWKARILAGSTDPGDIAAARSGYTRIAVERDFYGFLAADILGSAYNYEDQPGEVSVEEVLALEATPGIQRASELYALNELTRARREWLFTTRDFSPRELKIAARVSQRWGQFNQAIRAMISARDWNDLAMRFPLPYQESFITNAHTADISPQWSIAIARQESAFMPDARSGAGAMGLMQLMPSTARQTARRFGVDFNKDQQLIDPYLNIQLGTAYLGSMYRRFSRNRILASAAYNAGPSRVNSWLNPNLPLDIWIETIPFKETRQYVQNVLMFSNIYAHRMNLPQPLIMPGEWQDFATVEITLSTPPATPAATAALPDNS